MLTLSALLEIKMHSELNDRHVDQKKYKSISETLMSAMMNDTENYKARYVLLVWHVYNDEQYLATDLARQIHASQLKNNSVIGLDDVIKFVNSINILDEHQMVLMKKILMMSYE